MSGVAISAYKDFFNAMLVSASKSELATMLRAARTAQNETAREIADALTEEASRPDRPRMMLRYVELDGMIADICDKLAVD